MKPSRPSQRGYSLVEMLVVVAMIGVLSLVTVPNFINLYRGSKMKSSLQLFLNDVRNARQKAVARVAPTKISWVHGEREYRAYLGADTGSEVVWTEVQLPQFVVPAGGIQRRRLDEIAYFQAPGSNAMTDQDTPADGLVDIIFLPNGQALFSPTTRTFENVILKTDANVGKPTYTVTVSNTGRVVSQ